MKYLLTTLISVLIFTSFAIGQKSSEPTSELLSQITKLRGSESWVNEGFGSEMKADGDTLIIAVPWDLYVPTNNVQGGAYIFIRNGSTWTEQAHLVLPDGLQLDYFGYSVDISGDTAIVGASYREVGGVANVGCAYIYVRTGTTWTLQQQLLASDGLQNEHFGYDVSVSGDTAVVISREALRNGQHGVADVYTRTGTTWTFQQRIQKPASGLNDYFGSSVSLDGERMLIATSSGVPNGSFGEAFVFERTGGVWTDTKRLVSPGSVTSDGFGSAIDLDGDTVVLTAFKYAPNQTIGSAIVFVKAGSDWVPQATLRPNESQGLSRFGESVALDGDRLVVGDPYSIVRNISYHGAAFAFGRSGTSWTQLEKLAATDGEYNDSGGRSVAITGTSIFYGAPGNGQNDPGSAYVFAGPFAAVSISGRVVLPNGRGNYPAYLTITDSAGYLRHVLTNHFGYYRILDVQPQRSYTIRVRGKKHAYANRVITPTDNVTGFDFVP